MFKIFNKSRKNGINGGYSLATNSFFKKNSWSQNISLNHRKSFYFSHFAVNNKFIRLCCKLLLSVKNPGCQFKFCFKGLPIILLNVVFNTEKYEWLRFENHAISLFFNDFSRCRSACNWPIWWPPSQFITFEAHGARSCSLFWRLRTQGNPQGLKVNQPALWCGFLIPWLVWAAIRWQECRFPIQVAFIYSFDVFSRCWCNSSAPLIDLELIWNLIRNWKQNMV